MKCKNCDQNLAGAYCSYCGQKADVGPLNFPNFLREISESIFQVNRGLFFTIKALFLNPAGNLEAYLAGKRKPFVKPLAYVLSLSTLYYLAGQWTTQNTWLDDVIAGWLNAEQENTSEAIPLLIARLKRNFAYLNLLLLPLFALASYLAFKPFGKNYFEHLVLNAYLSGQKALIYTLMILLGKIAPSVLWENIPYLLATAYTFWVFWRLFREGNRIVNILRSLLSYLIYWVLILAFALSLLALSGLK